MKTLVVFYSRDGNTRRAAEVIATILNADLDEIIDERKRKGVLGFLSAGYDATLGRTTNIKFTKNPSNYDLIIIGTPVWNGRVTPAVRTYILKNKDSMKEVAFFATCGGMPGKCLKQMHELYNDRVLAEKVIHRKKIKEGAESLARDIIRLIKSY